MGPSAEAVSKASEWPVLIYVLAIVMTIGIIVSAVEKVSGAFGKLGKAAREWALSRRRAADEDEDARFTDMARQIAHLSARSEQRDQVEQSMYAILIEHQAWDRRVLSATDAGELVGPPPPLWPTSVPLTQPPVTPGASSSPEETP